VIIPQNGLGKTQIVIGECKDRGGIIEENDVANMRAIADAFPKDRFEAYILFAKLAAFTEEEIARAAALNGQYEYRVLLLTDWELEPYHLYDRRREELGSGSHAINPKDVAEITHRLYFTKPPAPAQPPQQEGSG
jgi:hypothetical protein